MAKLFIHMIECLPIIFTCILLNISCKSFGVHFIASELAFALIALMNILPCIFVGKLCFLRVEKIVQLNEVKIEKHIKII